MLAFLAANLRHRPSRALAFAAAILVASVSFVLLASAAKTSDLRVRGSVKQNFRNAYDILVRPRGSFSKVERESGLVRDNYLSGIFGGITMREYSAIKRIPGVEVAAPIANIAFILPFTSSPVLLDGVITKEPFQVYRVKRSYVAQAGLSHYASNESYVYYEARHPFIYDRRKGLLEVVPGRGRLPVGKWFTSEAPQPRGPFDPLTSIAAFSGLSPGVDIDSLFTPGYPFGKPAALVDFSFPILISAIDPTQESRLLHLDHAMVKGRYLRDGERPRVAGEHRLVPVIASTKTYIGDTALVDVRRLVVPAQADLPVRLSTRGSYRFMSRLRDAKSVGTRRFSAKSVYERMLRRDLFSDIYWVPFSATYRRAAEQRLRVRSTRNPVSVWKAPRYSSIGGSGYYPAPPDNADVQFRRLRSYPGRNDFSADEVYNTPSFRVVGRYDPAKLPGFRPLSKLPMETYYPPLVEGGDARSRQLLKGKPLLPTQNVGDYIQQPPLLLTTLAGMKPFFNHNYYTGVDGRAPISVIRVRVAKVEGPDPESRARIKAVALEIRDRTGLDVDITAGSSPRELLVDLPAGKFGRPELLLKEGWVKKGVSVSFLKALDHKRLVLLALIPLACAFFLVNGAFAAARARRRELGTLLCLGWPRRAIFAALLGELALIGLLAGLVGAALATAIVRLFALDVSLPRTLLVVPIALLLPVLAGLVPALRASREVPLAAVAPPVVAASSVRSVHGLRGLALANLARVPQRALVGVLGLVVGVAALTLIVGINQAFQGTLVGTLLGNAILFRISGLDFVALGVTIGLAACSLADVLFLNLRERSAELVTLRTLGWRQRHLAQVVALEAAGLGLVGGLAGALLGLALGLLLGVSASPLLGAAALAAAGGLLVALLASLLPLSRLSGLTAPVVLAEE